MRTFPVTIGTLQISVREFCDGDLDALDSLLRRRAIDDVLALGYTLSAAVEASQSVSFLGTGRLWAATLPGYVAILYQLSRRTDNPPTREQLYTAVRESTADAAKIALDAALEYLHPKSADRVDSKNSVPTTA